MEPSSAERCSGRYHVLRLAVRHLLYNSKPHRKLSAPPSILPRVVSFFNLRELVGISLVSKKWKEFCYEPEVVLGCISRGGVNEKDRANFWLQCVGMRDESVAQQPMGILDVVGLDFRSSEGDNDTTDGNGKEERRETLETLTDEDFLQESSKMLESLPLPPQNFQGRSSNWAQRVQQWRTSHRLNRNQSPSRLSRQSPPIQSASEHRKKLLQSDAGHRVCGLYDALRESSEAIDGCEFDEDLFASHPRRTITQIEKDVERTANFANKDALRSLLRAISLYIPKSVGYVQGQNFICRVLLTVTKEHEEDSFWACIGMMHHFGLLGIICPGMPTLRLRFFQMNRLVMWHLPKLFQHFHDNEVEAELYSTSWFITLLSDGSLLQGKDVLSLWDILFALCGDRDVQWAVVYRVILELMRLSEQAILILSSLPSIVGGMSKIMASHVAHAGGIVGLQSSAEIYLEHSVTMTMDFLCLVAASVPWTEISPHPTLPTAMCQCDEQYANDINLPTTTADNISSMGAMIVVGHDSGDVVTYSLRVDEKGLGAGGSLPLVLHAEATLCDHDDTVSAIATPDPWIGKGLMSGSWDGTVKVWDLTEGQPEFSCTNTVIIGGRVNGLAFAGGSRLAAAISSFNFLHLLDPRTTETGDRIALPCSPACVSSFFWGEENMGTIAVGGEDGTVYLYDQRALHSPVDNIEVGRNCIRCISSPRSAPGLLACGCDDGSVSVAHVSSRNVIRTPDVHEDYVGGLTWFEKGRDDGSSSSSPLYLASGGWDSFLRGLIVSPSLSGGGD